MGVFNAPLVIFINQYSGRLQNQSLERLVVWRRCGKDNMRAYPLNISATHSSFSLL